MKLRPAFVVSFLLLLLSSAAMGQSVYVASMRGQGGVGGTLFLAHSFSTGSLQQRAG